MKKKTVLIIINIAAYLFLALSIFSSMEFSDALNIFIPGTILFGSHLYCLKRLPEQTE